MSTDLTGDLWRTLVQSGHPITRPISGTAQIGHASQNSNGNSFGNTFGNALGSSNGRSIEAEGRGYSGVLDIHGTTVIAVKYDKGVINVGDRRATANFAIMYDQAEKVLPIDDFTLLAISGSFARAIEVVRYLRTTFKLFERTYLQPMSLDGKLAELAKVIRAGIPDAMNGIGGFIPILTTFDEERNEGRIFFYDGAGARFESTEFGAAGSGSTQIRGVFDYIVKTKKPFHAMTREEALKEALYLLDIAADLDAATGGWSKVLPLAKTISADGIEDVSDEELRTIVGEINSTGGERVAPRL